jgi:hypothetical protein
MEDEVLKCQTWAVAIQVQNEGQRSDDPKSIKLGFESLLIDPAGIRVFPDRRVRACNIWKTSLGVTIQTNLSELIS